MRARSNTLEMPALSPPPLVLRRRHRAKRAATWTGKQVLFVGLLFVAFAVAHRVGSHWLSQTECCAPTASAQKAR